MLGGAVGLSVNRIGYAVAAVARPTQSNLFERTSKVFTLLTTTVRLLIDSVNREIRVFVLELSGHLCYTCGKDRVEMQYKPPYKLHPTEKVIRNHTREATNYLIKYGHIARPKKCEQCRKYKKLDTHHTDYSDPFRIAWLCRACHAVETKDFVNTIKL